MPVDSAESLTQAAWIAFVLIAFLVVGCVLACLRRGIDQRSDVLLPVVLALIAIFVGSLVIDPRQNDTSGRREIELRALELMAQAALPNSPLACLNSVAGEAVEASCEQALFGSPETIAAAVSYVSTQLSLLSLGAGATQNSEPMLWLRRSLEADRFGIVAHLLAVRDGCTADRCEAFRLLSNAEHVRSNLAASTYGRRVSRHIASWSSKGTAATATATPSQGSAPPQTVQAAPAAPAFMAGTNPMPGGRGLPSTGAMSSAGTGVAVPSNSDINRPTTESKPRTTERAKDYFLPSADSIPAISIMTAEPTTPPPSPPSRGANRAAEANAARADDSRSRPARQTNERREPLPAPGAPAGAPMQLGPRAQ